MNHAFLAGSKLNKCAELFDADYRSLEDLSFLEICHDRLDHLYGFIHHSLIRTAYRDLSVIRNINLHPSAGNDLIDSLTALSYYIADLLRIDLDRMIFGA